MKPSAVFNSRHASNAVFFKHTSLGGALSGILNFELLMSSIIVYIVSDNAGPMLNWKWSGHVRLS